MMKEDRAGLLAQSFFWFTTQINVPFVLNSSYEWDCYSGYLIHFGTHRWAKD
jgi:hypothetical protein